MLVRKVHHLLVSCGTLMALNLLDDPTLSRSQFNKRIFYLNMSRV